MYLQNVNLATRGKYRCEISAEAPSFVTAAQEGLLEVNCKFVCFVFVCLFACALFVLTDTDVNLKECLALEIHDEQHITSSPSQDDSHSTHLYINNFVYFNFAIPLRRIDCVCVSVFQSY